MWYQSQVSFSETVNVLVSQPTVFVASLYTTVSAAAAVEEIYVATPEIQYSALWEKKG